MNTISGITIQNLPWDSYVPGSDTCDCGSCTVWTTQIPCGYTNKKVDWYYKNEQCCFPCPPQPACSKPNPNLCPIIGGNTGDINWYDNDDYELLSSRPVVCTYPGDSIKTTKDLEIWISTFGKNKSYNEIIMPNFCSAISYECGTPPYSPTSTTICQNGLTGCSIFTSNSINGTICREWANNNPQLYNDTAKKFCASNICSTDCLCYNRNIVDPTYISIQKSGNAPKEIYSSCWYVPCQNNEDYLIPENLKISAGLCPNAICNNISNITNTNNIQNDTFTSCDVSEVNQDPNPPTSFWGTYYAWIIIGVISFLAFVVIILIALIYYKYKKDSKKIEEYVII